MAIPFLNHINLSNNEVQNVRLHNTASITVSSGLGHLYFDTDDGLAKYYRANNDWVTIDPITDASLSGTTLTLSRVQANLTVDLASLLPTNIVETITTTDGTYINLTPNSATDGDVTVTADLSAIDGTSDTTTRFLSKDNTWDVPSYTTVTTTDGTFIELTPNSATSGAVTVTADLSAVDGTSGANERYLTKTNKWATVDSITGTTYDLAVTAGGSNDAAIELTGSDSTTDTVTISGSGTTVKVTESGNIITLDLQDDVTIANNLTVQGNLEVEGTTTTIESTITTFTDPVIELNKVADGGTQGNPLTSSGVEIKRSGGNDVQLVWMEDSDDWEFQAYNHRPGLEGGVQKKQYKLPTSYKTTIGGATSIDVDHYLGTRDVIVQLYDTSSYETVYADVTRTSEQTVTIDFTTAPGAGDVTVLIISAQGEQ